MRNGDVYKIKSMIEAGASEETIRNRFQNDYPKETNFLKFVNEGLAEKAKANGEKAEKAAADKVAAEKAAAKKVAAEKAAAKKAAEKEVEEKPSLLEKITGKNKSDKKPDPLG